MSKSEPCAEEADALVVSDLVRLWPRPFMWDPSVCNHAAFYPKDETYTEWRCYWCDKDFPELPRWQKV